VRLALVEQVDHGEGQRAPVAAQHFARGVQEIALLAHPRGGGAQLAQGRHPPLSDDAPGVLGDDAEHPGDDAVVAGQRTVRKRVVGLLGIAAALEDEHERLVPGGLAGGEHGLDPGPDLGPDLRPHLTRRPAQRPRVLLAQRVPTIGPIAEEGELGTPRHPHGEARGQQHADNRGQGGRPLLDRPQRSRGPVDVERVPSDLSGLGQELLQALGGSFSAHAQTPPGECVRARSSTAHPSELSVLLSVKFGFRSAAASSRCDGTCPSTKRLQIWTTCGAWQTPSKRCF